MKIDAIILSNSSDLSHYGLTCRTVNSLKDSDREGEINIIVVESQNYLRFAQSGYSYNGCITVHPEQKFGYNKFLNIGLQHSKSDWILICNNDLFFTKDWLIEAKNIIEKYPNIKSFSPRCPNWHLHQNMAGDLLIGYTVSKNVCGWCILLHKTLINKYDLFDEQFDFWYQDNDYAMTLQKNGEQHGLIVNSKVYHMVSGSHDTLNERYDELTIQQQEKFLNKWKNHF